MLYQTRLKRCPAETLSPAISILEESFNCDSVMKPLEIKSVQRPGWEIVFRQARLPDDEIKINVDELYFVEGCMSSLGQ